VSKSTLLIFFTAKALSASVQIIDRVKEMLPEGGHDLLRLEIIEFQKFIEERHITRSRKTQGKVESLL
jgi:hypothetical protein